MTEKNRREDEYISETRRNEDAMLKESRRHDTVVQRDELLAYRVGIIEKGHEELSEAVSDLRDFANSIRLYARLAMFVWPIAQAGITAVVVALLVNR